MNVRVIGLCFLMNFYNLQSSCDQEYNSLTQQDQISTARQTNTSQTHRRTQIQSNLPEGKFHKLSVHSEIAPDVTGRKITFGDKSPKMIQVETHQPNGQITSETIESTGLIGSIHYVPTLYGQHASASKRSWFSKVFCGCCFSDAAINPRKIHPSQS